MAIEVCQVCGQGRVEHDYPEVHHLFSTDGQLVPKEKPKPKPANAREHIVAPPGEKAATRLAAVLHDRGLIDSEELVWVLTGGVRPHGSNTAAGNGATGDLRARAEAEAG